MPSAVRIAALICIAAYAVAPDKRLNAYPAQVSQIAPVSGPTTNDAVQLPSGNWSVSTRTGAAQYSYPLAMPPFPGPQPSLAFEYSSRSGWGNIAEGWRLSIPQIRLDTSQGRLAGTHYLSTLAGGQRLVPIPDEPIISLGGGVTTYRVAEGDQSYTRYEHSGGLPGVWKAITQGKDGHQVTYVFGGTPSARDARVPGAPVVGARWFVTRIYDEFGHEVVFEYQKVRGKAYGGTINHVDQVEALDVAVDISLRNIYFNSKDAEDETNHQLARVEFSYSPVLFTCGESNIPIGARFHYNSGIRIYEGAQQLNAIRTYLSKTFSADGEPHLARTVNLLFDHEAQNCFNDHRAFRQLRHIHEVVRNTPTISAPEVTTTSSPLVTFEYSDFTHSFSDENVRIDSPGDGAHSIRLRVGSGKHRLNVSKAGGYPTVDTLFLDLDGDGARDVIESSFERNGQKCGYRWWRNIGNGNFSAPQTHQLPTLPWSRGPGMPPITKEGCSLSGQFTQRSNLGAIPTQSRCLGVSANYNSYHIFDVDGDGLPDLVTSLNFNKGRYRPADDDAMTFWRQLPDGLETPPACVGSGGPTPCLLDSFFGLPLDPGISFARPPVVDLNISCPLRTCEIPGCQDSFSWPESGTAPDEEGIRDRRNSARSSCCSSFFCSDWGADLSIVGTLRSPPIPKAIALRGWDWFGAIAGHGEVGGENFPPHRINVKCTQVPEMQDGWYFVRVHFNRGDGTFEPKPTTRLWQVPLESDRPVGALGVTDAATESSWHATGIDMDGDAINDLVFLHPSWMDRDWNGDLLVFRGDGDGSYSGKRDGSPYVWSVPEEVRDSRIALRRSTPSLEATSGVRHPNIDLEKALRDTNGDGLPDLLHSRTWVGDPPSLRVYYNTGTGFERPPVEGAVTVLSDELPTISRQTKVNVEEVPNEPRDPYSWSIAENPPSRHQSRRTF